MCMHVNKMTWPFYLKVGIYYALNVCVPHPQSYIDALAPNRMVLRGG